MSFSESRNLILRTTDISFSNNPVDYFNTTLTSPTGSVTQNRQSITWTNINLRTLMGNEFYNRFSQFELKLMQISVGQTRQALLTDASYNATKNVYLSGLPFTTGERVLLTSIVVNLPLTYSGRGHATVQSCITSNIFNKTEVESVNITIDVFPSTSSTQFYEPATTNLLYGHSEYLFEIYGI